jgi:hypothetical protein
MLTFDKIIAGADLFRLHRGIAGDGGKSALTPIPPSARSSAYLIFSDPPFYVLHSASVTMIREYCSNDWEAAREIYDLAKPMVT